MHFALLLLQSSQPDQMPEFLQRIGIATGGALAIVGVALLIALLILRFITMWWFGVTTVIDRLDSVISRLDSVERATKGK